MADSKSTNTAVQTTVPTKWTGCGINDEVLNCALEPAWDLFSDWANWGRWYSGPDICELREGENRKPGCVRVLQFPDTMWLHERILDIDNDKHFMSYAIDANSVHGVGIKGFVAAIEFRETGDGKTLVPYWKFELEPVEGQSSEAFHAYVAPVFKAILTELEKGAQKVAAGGLDVKPVKQTTEDSSATV